MTNKLPLPVGKSFSKIHRDDCALGISTDKIDGNNAKNTLFLYQIG